nr:myb-like domain, Myb/SANT-like DNA-binding domain protein [Tanacetum cinerariifolium]
MHGDCQRFNAIYKYLTRKSRENDVDLVENAKTTYMERYGNKKFQYAHVWNILKNYLKWNAAEPIDKDNLQELFGLDPRERPAGKQRASKKQKSVDTSSAGGSTGGSQSESTSSLVSQDYKRKCDAAERSWSPKVTLGRLLPHARGLGFKPRRRCFPSGAKKVWGLSPKAKVRVLHTTQLDVIVSSNH